MSITQTIDIPVSHKLTIDVPREVPAGRAVITFTPAPAKESIGRRSETAKLPGGIARSIEEALQLAEEKAKDPNRKPISRFFGILSQNTYGDGVTYQRAIRDEWDD